MITPELWLSLYNSCYFKKVHHARGNGSSSYIYKTLPNAKSESLGRELSNSLCSELRLRIFTTSNLKKSLQDYFLSQSITFQFLVLNEVFKSSWDRNNRVKSFFPTGLSYKKWSLNFISLGYSIKPYACGRIAITKGSFYIDGRWIHVG